MRHASALEGWFESIDFTDHCWLWKRWRNPKGYGMVSLFGKNYRAHRVAWLLATGEPLAKGMALDHLCRVRECVNPDHLREMTGEQNTLIGLSGAYYFQNRLLGFENRREWPSCPIDCRLKLAKENVT